MSPPVRLLHGAVRSYAWGSRWAIAQLQRRPAPTPYPEAELWFGAHPADPAQVVGVGSLLDLIGTDPDGQLGAASRAEFGDRLPFLLKVLAADEPLSLQAHPSAAQAEQGFALEEHRGVARDAPERNYTDPSHKPELLCALSTFEALAGFRDAGETVDLLAALDSPELVGYAALLSGQPDPAGLRALFTTWITLPIPALEVLLPAVLDACVAHVRAHGRFTAEARTALDLSERYPGDAGVLTSLLLNRIILQPGQAIYLPAGNLHAYLSGVGVELMASSDNVLRGGLTPKHVDVPELLRVLDFAAGAVPVLTADPEAGFHTPTHEFRLCTAELGPGEAVTVHHPGPQVLLVTEGEITVAGAGLVVAPGRAAWVPAAAGAVGVTAGGHGARVFRATDGLGG